ncbi:SDR family oxidoreductase [Thalassotalea psychrophila]|uniref:SDR family oxidoreductase n=1 Tax=Thalassotalea psychrophila TaxID=3065647 RepID=A0ABY9TXG3_9GAMM|nr:SDR family oxidoreductase [Colwelliaceae bacterium SQ149]
MSKKVSKGMILITGADGYLGHAIATYLLANSNMQLCLWVKASSVQSIAVKKQRLASLLEDSRCKFVYGDLTDEKVFSDINPTVITHIIHSAAVTNFAVEKNDAYQVNVLGTRKLLKFAQRCNSLKCISLISTLYAAGLDTQVIDELPIQPTPQFANHYEWSKYNAEVLLIEEFTSLPWQIVRVATIVADNELGEVNQYNVFHQTLRLLFYGLLAVMPGEESTKVYLTTRDQSAQLCGQLLLNESRGFFHSSIDDDHALALGTLIDEVYSQFNLYDEFVKKRILKPRFASWFAFKKLIDGTQSLGSILGQALTVMAPFSQQLYANKVVKNERTRASSNVSVNFSVKKILPKVCSYLIENKWGRTTTNKHSSKVTKQGMKTHG